MYAYMGYMILSVLITFSFISEPFFVVHLLFFTLFSFSPIYREKKPLSPPVVAKGCLGMWEGGNPSLSKKIGDLRIYFSNLHLKIRNIFSQTKKENLLASKSLFLLSFIIWETPSLKLELHTFKISTMSKFNIFFH
jgi:hypothetical protein